MGMKCVVDEGMLGVFAWLIKYTIKNSRCQMKTAL
jgi:hypothetical protein